jgi:hypothetical protein
VVREKARRRWAEHLQFMSEAGPGDFIFVPPYVPHQEINASPDETLECVLVRSDGESIAINLDVERSRSPRRYFGSIPFIGHPGTGFRHSIGLGETPSRPAPYPASRPLGC